VGAIVEPDRRFVVVVVGKNVVFWGFIDDGRGVLGRNSCVLFIDGDIFARGGICVRCGGGGGSGNGEGIGYRGHDVRVYVCLFVLYAL
jgi:hypothetical protein